jgi:Fuc2NAc and GlcNAc transferase
MFQNLLHNLPFVVQGLIVAAAAMVACLLLGTPVRRLGMRLNIMDVPNQRSSHTRTVPRTGGVAIVLAMIVTLALFGRPTAPLLVVLALGALASVISFIDDTISLSSVPRLFVHLGVAGVSVYMIDLQLTGLELPYVTIPFPAWVGLVVAALYVTAFVNFFNFMDGINGIAAAQGIVGGAALAILLAAFGASNSTIVAAALVGGCLGFVPYNFPRATMFMGDMGSTTIGFTLAMMTLLAARRYPWIACLLPLGVFIYDAMFTMFKRMLRGENILKAHREHHYQLLIRSGWSHVRVTSLQFGLMLLCGAAALVYAWTDSDLVRLSVLLTLLTVFVTYSVLVHRHFARHGKTESPPTPPVSPANP